MAWDKTKPLITDIENTFPAQQQANNAALEATISAEHQFPGTGKDGQHKFPVVAVSATGAEGRLQILNDILNWYSNGAWRTTSTFPAGTVMLFVQTAAPTGWVKNALHNNKALRIVSGTAGQGGTVDFTTAFASQAVNGTVGSHVLTVAEIPSHNHTVSCSAESDTAGGNLAGALYPNITPGTSYTGGGGGHSHTFAGTAINMAVKYIDSIIATKS